MVIACMGNKDLGFVCEPSKSSGMNNPVPISLVGISKRMIYFREVSAFAEVSFHG
jgi:hypothetical protein